MWCSRLKHLVISVPLVWTAFGQTNAGSITGTVLDQQHAVMAGVRIAATNLATNVSQTAASSSAGAYTIPALEPGAYTLTAEINGFKKLVRGPIAVDASKTVVIDLEMAVGSTAAEVIVTADAPLVQQSSSTVQYGINEKALDELPLTNQSAMQVMTVLPGVLGNPGSDVAGVATTTNLPAPGSTVSIAGARFGSTLYQADGVSNNASYLNRISLGFSSDAVEQVTVLVNSYSAEYGRVAGGIVDMTTKSGTNRIHGTVFSFSQNDALNASPFANTWAKKGMTRYWRGGIDVGGPVWLPGLYHGENRTFFFVGYEPVRQYTQTPYYVRTPTAAERQGDYSHSVYNSAQNIPVLIFQQFQFNQSGTALTDKRIVLAANGVPSMAG